METGNAILIFIFLIMICYMIYDKMPSKYTKLEESFGGFMNRSLVRFEFEKSPLHILFMVVLVQARLILLDNT